MHVIISAWVDILRIIEDAAIEKILINPPSYPAAISSAVIDTQAAGCAV